jgi:hypothetical protein
MTKGPQIAFFRIGVDVSSALVLLLDCIRRRAVEEASPISLGE